MKLKHIFALCAFSLPCEAQQDLTASSKPIGSAPTPEAIGKVTALIDAKAKFEQAQAALRTEGVEPINIDGGTLLAIPAAGNNPAQFLKNLKELKNLSAIQIGGHLGAATNGDTSLDLMEIGQSLVAAQEIEKLKNDNQRLTYLNGELVTKITALDTRLAAANSDIRRLLDMINHEIPNPVPAPPNPTPAPNTPPPLSK